MAVTPTVIREHIETDIGDSALQRLIDDAEQEIVARHGDLGMRTETFNAHGITRIYLQRAADSVTTVTETVGTTETELASDDYRLLYGNRALERRNDGTNSRSTWGWRVVVTYTPADESMRRDRLTIDLVNLALGYQGYITGTTSGDVRTVMMTSPGDYQAERERLLRSLNSGSLRLA